MEEKLAVTIRFHSKGKEAELYQKIQEGRTKAGLSLSEYVKRILEEYFEGSENRCTVEIMLREIKEEYRSMAGRIEKTIQCSIQEHDAILLTALGRMGVASVVQENDDKVVTHAQLPKESADIPEGALDFLNGLC